MSYVKASWFVAGTLFGSLGLKLLSSKDAQKFYVHVTAAGLRAKDQVMNTVTTVQEAASDILASAKDLNEERAAKEAAAQEAAQIQDESAEVVQEHCVAEVEAQPVQAAETETEN